jgi:hypothetical protein
MSDAIGPGPQESALISRVKAILLTPKDEWPKIDAEMADIADVYKSHVIPLAAIGPVASFIGGQVFGIGAFGFTYKPGFMAGLSSALFGYAMALIGVFLLALVIDFLAPNFGATKNQTKAFKTAAYAGTAGWVAGVAGIIPSLGMLIGLIGAVYAVYLLYLGLPVLMKAPADKAAGYTAVTVLAAILLAFAISLVTAPVAALFGGAAAMSGASTGSGTITTPAGSVDLGKLEEAGKKLEESTKAMQNGQGKPAIATDVLQALMPAALPGGLTRTSIESASAGAAGMGGSNVEARYGSGDTEIRLSITDLGAMGGLAAMGSAFNVQSSKETATSYEKVGKVDGRMTTEKYDSTDRRGGYGTLVGDRIMVQAEGNAPSIDALKAAVAAVDLSKVEALAKQ